MQPSVDYKAIEASLCPCRVCESLVDADSMALADGGPVCYGCSAIARGLIAWELEIVSEGEA